MDQRLSMIKFLSVDTDHPRYKALFQSETTHDIDDLHKPDRKQRAGKLKTLFIDGKQTTVHHLHNVYCNYLTLLRYMYDNATETAQYKVIYNFSTTSMIAKGLNGLINVDACMLGSFIQWCWN